MTTYREHLKSPQWTEIRHAAKARSQGLCELCGAAGAETHHIKYPRNFSNDSVEKVIYVCSACHRRLHGMTELITDRQLVEIHRSTFKDRPVCLWVDEQRAVWAPFPTWARALVIPTPMVARISAGCISAASQLSIRREQPYMLPDAKNVPWFRWHAVDETLIKWYMSFRARMPGGATATIADAHLNEDEMLLFNNYQAIRDWGTDLQEQALAGKLTTPAGSADSTVASSELLDQALALVIQAQRKTNVRVEQLEYLTIKDPDEFIDAASFVIEKGRRTSMVIAGTRQTIQQWLGQELEKRGVQQGPRVSIRLETSTIIRDVASWRRRDLDTIWPTALARIGNAGLH